MQDPVPCPMEGGAQGTKLFPDSYPKPGWMPSLGPKVYCGCGHESTFGIREGYRWLADHSVKFRCEECDKKQCTVCDGVLRRNMLTKSRRAMLRRPRNLPRLPQARTCACGKFPQAWSAHTALPPKKKTTAPAPEPVSETAPTETAPTEPAPTEPAPTEPVPTEGDVPADQKHQASAEGKQGNAENPFDLVRPKKSKAKSPSKCR
eukprot:g56046.t1